MQRYEKFEGGQEGRKWYVDLAEFGIGIHARRNAQTTVRTRVRVSLDALNRVVFRGESG